MCSLFVSISMRRIRSNRVRIGHLNERVSSIRDVEQVIGNCESDFESESYFDSESRFASDLIVWFARVELYTTTLANG